MQIILTLVMMICIMPKTMVKADEVEKEKGGWTYYEDKNVGIVVTGYTGNDTDVTIPKKIDGKAVKGIEGKIFNGNMKTITIPSNISFMGDWAFSFKDSIENVIIQDGVNISAHAFYGCENLKSVVIPESVTEIGYYAFGYCQNLTIYGYAGSSAEEFAKEYDIPFKNISEYKISVSKPSALKQKAAATNSITLTWKKQGAVKYEVYRSTKKKSGYKKIATVSKNSYKDTKLKAGTTYYYKVRATKTVEKKTYNSSYSAVLKAVTKPANTKISLKAGTGQIKVSWKKVSGTVKYEVYLSTAKNGKYRRVITTRKTSYTITKLKTGKRYYIKVRSYKKNGSGKKYYSAYSSIKSVKVK